MKRNHRDNLLEIYHAALAAVNGRRCVNDYLTAHPLSAPVHIVAIGKAAAAMAAGANEALNRQLVHGLVITKHGYNDPPLPLSAPFTVIETGHPLPDEDSLRAGRMLLQFIADIPQDTNLLFLISGGASALVEVLPDGVTFDELEKVNRWLLGAGFPIANINAVRKAVSCIKGGRLARELNGRHTLQLLMSDVQGDDPATIGSGLLVADQLSTAIIQNLTLPDWIDDIIKRAEAMPPTGDGCFKNIETEIVACAADARDGATEKARELNYDVFPHDEFVAGDVAKAAHYIMEKLDSSPPSLHVWSSEVTVKLPDEPGQGGRCQHLALEIAQMIAGREDVVLLAAGTDGTDGSSDDAGAIVDGGTVERGTDNGLDVEDCLKRANAGEFLGESGDLVDAGVGTGTNVTDLILGLKTDVL